MKVKVMLIEPPISTDKSEKFPTHQIPLGFLYMGDILQKNNFEVKILDCPLYYKQKRQIDKNTFKFGLFPEQIKQAIKEFNPDIIGVSCSYTMFEKDSFEVIDLIKKVNNKIKIIIGGAHASSNPEFVLRNKNIDLIVIGEGEYTLLEIAEKVRDTKPLQNIKGTALVYNGKFKKNSPREQIQDLDKLDLAWNLINLEEYFQHPDNSEVAIRTPSANLITSRGCPGQCVFCSVHTVWGRKWRAMSPKKVVDEIEYLYKQHNVKNFRINDDNLTLDKKRIIQICEEIKKRNLDIKWDTPSGVAFWTLDEEVLDAMKSAGYYRVTFGIESGCKETLKYIRKNIDLKKVNRLIDYSHKIGLWTASFFIIGFPFETKQQIKTTTDFIINSNLNFPFIFIAQPYLGTDLYEDFKKAGLLKESSIEGSTPMNTKYYSKYLSPEELNIIKKKIYIKFYFKKLLRYSNPYFSYKEFFSKIKTYEDVKYVYKILKSLITTFSY